MLCKETKGEESLVIYKILGEFLQIGGGYSVCFEKSLFKISPHSKYREIN